MSAHADTNEDVRPNTAGLRSPSFTSWRPTPADLADLALFANPARLVGERERALMTSIGNTAWRQLEAEGRAPPAVRIGASATVGPAHRRWLLRDLMEWNEARAAEAAK